MDTPIRSSSPKEDSSFTGIAVELSEEEQAVLDVCLTWSSDAPLESDPRVRSFLEKHPEKQGAIRKLQVLALARRVMNGREKQP